MNSINIKNNRKIYFLSFISFLIFLVFYLYVNADDIFPPSVTTEEPTEITAYNFQAHGIITDTGGENATAIGFSATNLDGGNTISGGQGGSYDQGLYSLSVGVLACESNYSYKFSATNSAGTTYGEDVFFTSGPCVAPEVTTQAVTNIGITTATANGYLDNNGGSTIIEKGFVWSTESEPTTDDNYSTAPGQSTGPYTVSLTNLIPSTLYYVRAYAINSEGIGYGDEVTFTTSAPSTFSISGTITDHEEQNPVINATVNLKQGDTVIANQLTNEVGYYIFETVDAGDYTIEVSKEAEPESDGIDIFDLNILRKDIVLLEPITNIYQKIAANTIHTDYNINIFDLNRLRQRAVMLVTALTPIWKFFNSDDIPTENTYLLQSKQQRTILELDDNLINQDFLSVKMGDINNDWEDEEVSYTLTYTAGTGGTISGTTPQTVPSGGNGTQVTAVPNSGYVFSSWSDGVMTASRTDENVTANISVTANFSLAIADCGEDFTDSRDSQVYSTVQIGNQCWMAKNLNVGTQIYMSPTDNGTIEKYCYGNDPANCVIYGGLYTWNEAMNYETTEGIQGICPVDWHLPTQNEFQTLITYLGGTSIAGGKMKEEGDTHWTNNFGATNESGLTAYGGGYYNYLFISFNTTANFISSTGGGSNFYHVRLYASGTASDILTISQSAFMSVRCLKDN